eukprot:Pgem_evm1s1892
MGKSNKRKHQIKLENKAKNKIFENDKKEKQNKIVNELQVETEAAAEKEKENKYNVIDYD